MKIELIYDSDCPNADAARAILRAACQQLKIDSIWIERARENPQSPGYCQNYGSPTILVNGHDVVPMDTIQGTGSCRVYTAEDGSLRGVPPIGVVVRALQRAASNSRQRPWLGWLTLPAIGGAFLPALTCPACWPAYAGILSAMGVSFVNYTPYLFPVTVLLLLVALGAIAYKARTRHGYGPLIVGTMSSIVLLLGRVCCGEDTWVTYVAAAGLLSASIWNAWPVRPGKIACCGGSTIVPGTES